MERSDTPAIHSVYLVEEFAGYLLKQIGTLNIQLIKSKSYVVKTLNDSAFIGKSLDQLTSNGK
jgi:hypothetical protein